MSSSNLKYIFNLGNSIIGVGVLAMPYCFSQCGILLAIVLLVACNLLTRITCYLLMKSSQITRRKSFETLAFHTFGSMGKLMVEISIIGFLIGCLIAYFVVMGDLGPDVISHLTGVEKTSSIRTLVLVFLGVFVILPFSLLRQLDSLTTVSVLSIIFYVIFILKIFFQSLPNLWSGEWMNSVQIWNTGGVLTCLPIFTMALSCQTQFFEILKIVPDPSSKKMASIVAGAVNLCTSVYILFEPKYATDEEGEESLSSSQSNSEDDEKASRIGEQSWCESQLIVLARNLKQKIGKRGKVGLLGYISFYSEDIKGNLLIMFPSSLVTEAVRFGFVLSVAVSFPLAIFPCRASIHSLLFGKGAGGVFDSISNLIPDNHFRLITVCIVLGTWMIGVLIPNIELVLGLNGSTVGTIICVILPTIMFIKVTSKNTNEKLLAQFVFGIGVFVLVASTYATLQNADKAALSNLERAAASLAPALKQHAELGIADVHLILFGIILYKIKIKSVELRSADSQTGLPIGNNISFKLKQEIATNNSKKEPPIPESPIEKKDGPKPAEEKVAVKDDSVKADESKMKREEALIKKLDEQRIQQEKLIKQQKELLNDIKQHHEKLDFSEKKQSENKIGIKSDIEYRKPNVNLQRGNNDPHSQDRKDFSQGVQKKSGESVHYNPVSTDKKIFLERKVVIEDAAPKLIAAQKILEVPKVENNIDNVGNIKKITLDENVKSVNDVNKGNDRDLLENGRSQNKIEAPGNLANDDTRNNHVPEMQKPGLNN
ncbi:putative sodium-coupled neutral amino acid transporter 10 [Nymphon striatum]|nr:putative sodium-coupled neutral amino acid transporter 10 [Nymphon striatum]